MKALRKIILIDDDEDFCYLHKLQLEETTLAREVITITDSWQALQFIISHYYKKRFSEDEPDLILLDLNMPGMTGTVRRRG